MAFIELMHRNKLNITYYSDSKNDGEMRVKFEDLCAKTGI